MPAIKLTDGYLLKQLTFKDRGIKKVKIFSPFVNSVTQPQAPDNQRKYIFIATYQHKVPNEGKADGGDFAPTTRAPSIYYQLEVLQMPRVGNLWKEFSDQFLLDNAIIEKKFLENQVIN